jgi:preprotein translocase subunit YajC
MNIDKAIGSITILVILLLVIYVAFAMWQNERLSQNTVYVLFSEIGSLQNEDEVTIRGYKIGYVASITMASDSIIMANDSIRLFNDSTKREDGKRVAMALVKIDLYEPFTFSRDTKFRNVSPSILGSRSIAVELGKSGKRAPKDFIFNGEFEAGFAEVLALSDWAKEQVALLMEMIRLLQTGDSKDPSLQKKIEDMLEDCENLVNALSGIVGSVEKQTLNAMLKVNGYTDQIYDASIKINKSLDTIRVQAKDGVASLNKVVLDIQSSIESLSNVLIEFESSPIAVALLDKKEMVDDIVSLISTLQSILGSIDNEGLKIYDENGKRKSMLSLKNIHLLRETARNKAKKREAEENAVSE